MSEDQQTAFGNATIVAVADITGCSPDFGCQPNLQNVCGKNARRGLRSSSRSLQTSVYQVDYQITQTFTCERANCNSPSDAMTTQFLTANIIATIEAALSGDEFLTVLSTNMLSSGSFSADVGACIAVWGVIGVEGLAVNPPAENVTHAFYPDWESHSGTCLQDGNQPMHMELSPDFWLFDNLEACCDTYFSGWNLNKCLNEKGSGLWYVSHQLEICVTDCYEGQGKTCGGLANTVSDDLFENPRSCCESELPWRFLDFCEAKSLQSNCYGGTGKYYRGDQTSSGIVCVKDCDYFAEQDPTCGGLVEDFFIVLHDTPEECCSKEYSWMTSELCVARTTLTNTNIFWPDKTNSKCFLDWETPAQDLSVPAYSSMGKCCKESIYWLSDEACLTASGSSIDVAATNKFFISWDRENERCVQDSEGPNNSPAPWDDLYDTILECCNMIPYIPEKDCLGV